MGLGTRGAPASQTPPKGGPGRADDRRCPERVAPAVRPSDHLVASVDALGRERGVTGLVARPPQAAYRSAAGGGGTSALSTAASRLRKGEAPQSGRPSAGRARGGRFWSRARGGTEPHAKRTSVVGTCTTFVVLDDLKRELVRGGVRDPSGPMAPRARSPEPVFAKRLSDGNSADRRVDLPGLPHGHSPHQPLTRMRVSPGGGRAM